MNNTLTEIVFILDRSGSMSGLESDTIGGFNSMLARQQAAAEGEAAITTVLFDDKYELLHDRTPLKAVTPMTGRQYYVRGSTALLDAVGQTIHKISTAYKYTAGNRCAGKVMVIITTDGLENASREYSYEQVRNMIEHQREAHGWEFIFLGANMDAVQVAGRFGISADRAATYHADSEGTQLNYAAMGEAIDDFRASRPVAASWKTKIEQDYADRRKSAD